MKNMLFNTLMLLMLFGATVNAGEYLYGDADCSHSITSADASMLLQKVLDNSYTLPIEAAASDYERVLDLDGDGALTAVDCAYLLQKILNISYRLPCEIIDDTKATTVTEAATESTTESPKDSLNINMYIGEKSYSVTLYDNPSAREFINRLPMTINMSELNGNEKYCFFNESYPSRPESVGSISKGDLMLYGDDCVVLFYDDFNTSYRYTPLGKADNSEDIYNSVGDGDVTVTFTK